MHTTLVSLLGEGLGGRCGYYFAERLIKELGDSGTALLLLFLLIVWCVMINKRFVHFLENIFRRKKQKEVKKIVKKTDEEKKEEKEEEIEDENRSLY
jgi:predicted PurR-regulated permease PerM